MKVLADDITTGGTVDGVDVSTLPALIAAKQDAWVYGGYLTSTGTLGVDNLDNRKIYFCDKGLTITIEDSGVSEGFMIRFVVIPTGTTTFTTADDWYNSGTCDVSNCGAYVDWIWINDKWLTVGNYSC